MDRPWSRVPSWVGAALRPELAGATDEVIAAVRAEVPDYARPLTGRFGMRITEGVSVALGQFIDLLGRDESLGDASVYRALGQLEHREGRTLAALQSAYQVGTRTMWRRLGGSTTARQLPPEVIFSLAEALFSYVEQISAASVAGWAYEESSRASSMQARRHALVELLARQPPAAPAEVERVAAAAGWVLPGRLAALVVEDAVAVAGRLPGAIGADLDPIGVAIVSLGATAERTCRARAGRAANPHRTAPAGSTGYGPGWAGGGRCSGRWSSPSQAHRSIARAQAAWPLHVAGLLHPGSDETLARADEHLLALLLAAEPQLAADLYERAVAPLRTLPAGAAARGEETLRAWLDAHGDITATAAALHVHPQTVRYRLAGLRDAFGGALDDPAARLELAVALRMSVDSCTGTDHPGALTRARQRPVGPPVRARARHWTRGRRSAGAGAAPNRTTGPSAQTYWTRVPLARSGGRPAAASAAAGASTNHTTGPSAQTYWTRVPLARSGGAPNRSIRRCRREHQPHDRPVRPDLLDEGAARSTPAGGSGAGGPLT